MSKDKGAKNKKKAPADKSAGKTKASSSYQEENKRDDKQPMLEELTPKPDAKGGGKRK